MRAASLRLRFLAASTLALGALLAGCDRGGGSGRAAPATSTAAPTTTAATTAPGATAATAAPSAPSAAPPPSSSPAAPPAGAPAPGEMRALWVTRWYARDEAAIRRAVDLIKDHGLNTLLLQVYGDASALYASSVAPRSHLVQPGFDALEAALRLARPEGIEVHAWMNVTNVWSGALGTPADPAHIINAHPEWAMVDGQGRSLIQNLGSAGAAIFYCPQRAGFSDYVGRVVRELGVRYPDLTGVHLDYVRYPAGDICYCDAHLQAFHHAHGRDPSAGDPAFTAWRYEDITRLVSALHDDLRAVSPQTLLTAAVFPRSGQVFQDTYEWLRRGKLDAVLPMIYVNDVADFEARSLAWRQHSGGRLVVPGIDCARGLTGDQIAAARRAGAHGFALFASSIFDAAARAETLAATGGVAVHAPARPWRDGSPDYEAPLIHSVALGQVTANAAALAWSTDEATAGRVVAWGPGGAAGSAASTSARGFEHRATVGGLLPGTAYTFEVQVEDGAGNTTVQGGSFTTPVTAGPVEVDDSGPGFATAGAWTAGSSPGGHLGGYLWASARAQESASATWTPALAATGDYEVAVHYLHGANRCPRARFTIQTAGGTTDVLVDQTQPGSWLPLGTFALDPATARVRLSNESSSAGVVIADAVRFTPR